jgi:hypothetical protein
MKEILQIIKADNSDVIYIKLTAVLILLIFVFNATFSNISTRSWRPVLVVEEAVVPGENHRPWASNW